MKMFLLFILLSAVSAPSFAGAPSSCGEVDFADKFPPPRDQGDSSFCYSFAAADLLSEELGLPPEEALSALQMTSEYVSMSPSEVLAARSRVHFDYLTPIAQGADPRNPLSSNPRALRRRNFLDLPLQKRQGGYTDMMLAQALNQGFACREHEVPSQMMLRRAGDPQQKAFFVERLRRLSGGERIGWEEAKTAAAQNWGVARTRWLLSLTPDPTAPPCLSKNSDRPWKEVKGLLPAVQNWAAEKLRDEANAQCKNPVDLKKQDLQIHTSAFNPERQSTDLRRSREQLEELFEHRQPFVLQFNSCRLDDQHCRSGEYRGHAAVVVGRHWNETTRSCELKIKNSWGDGCPPHASPGRCEKGYWYASQKDLTQDYHEVVWLKGKSLRNHK